MDSWPLCALEWLKKFENSVTKGKLAEIINKKYLSLNIYEKIDIDKISCILVTDLNLATDLYQILIFLVWLPWVVMISRISRLFEKWRNKDSLLVYSKELRKTKILFTFKSIFLKYYNIFYLATISKPITPWFICVWQRTGFNTKRRHFIYSIQANNTVNCKIPFLNPTSIT